jgi:hypothetical protein
VNVLKSSDPERLTLLTWRIWCDPNSASKWQIRFNSAFKGLKVLYRKPSQDKMLQNVFKVTLEMYQTQSAQFFVVTSKQNTLFKCVCFAYFCLLAIETA